MYDIPRSVYPEATGLHPWYGAHGVPALRGATRWGEDDRVIAGHAAPLGLRSSERGRDSLVPIPYVSQGGCDEDHRRSSTKDLHFWQRSGLARCVAGVLKVAFFLMRVWWSWSGESNLGPSAHERTALNEPTAASP